MFPKNAELLVFLGCTQQNIPLTMIRKKVENTSPQLELFPVAGKKIEVTFTGERISSDGGLLLLREVENQIGIIKNASSGIDDWRDQRYIDHTIEEMLTQRVFQIAAGYEDCNHSNDLREDMVLKTCAGRFPQSGKELFNGTVFENATFKTIQNKIIKTAAWVKEMKTKIKVELPCFCTTKDLQQKSYQMLSVLRT